MKTTIRRWALVALTVALLAGAVAPAALAEATGGSLHIEGSEGVTLTMWCQMNYSTVEYYESYAQHPFFQWLKEQTGVNVEFVHPSSEQADQQLNLMIASQDFYDLLSNAWYPGGPQAGVDEGCFMDLNQYLEYLPDYIDYASCDDGSYGDWEWNDQLREIYQPTAQPSFIDHGCYTSKGELWCVSQVWATEWLPDCGGLIRKDWLDELNLEVPTTIDELETVLEAFATLGDDVIPMALPTAGYADSDGYLTAAFDIFPNYYPQLGLDGNIEGMTQLTDNFKEYLHLVSGWYSKGYIDRDFMNRDGSAVESLLMSDRLGVWLESWSEANYYNELYSGSDENFELVAMPSPKMTEDQTLHFKQNYVSSPCNYLCLTTDCDTPEIACQWLNTFFKQETNVRALYGEEGVTFNYTDGAYVMTDEYYANKEFYNTQFLSPGGHPGMDSFLAGSLKNSPEAYTEPSPRAQSQVIWASGCDAAFARPYIVFADDDWGTMDNACAEASTYAAPMILRFITGQADIDGEWDAYVATARELGYDLVCELWQKSLDNMG